MRIMTLLILAAVATQAQSSQADAPKRTILEPNQNLKKPAPAAEPVKPPSARQTPENARNASSSALDALSTSTENLNLIRDSNVRKLTTDGCAPEVSARINDLRTRLGIAAPSAAATKNSGSEPAALALASGWFKAPSDGAPVAAQQKKSDLLDSVLPGADKTAKPADACDQDAGALQAELDHLLASCSGAKR